MERDKAQTHDHSNHHGSIEKCRMKQEINQLVEAIKNSDEYIRLQQAKRKLAEFPDLMKQVNEFRVRNYQLNREGAPNLFEMMEHMEHEYAVMRENPYVQEFLASELAICRMFQQVNWTLLRELDFDPSFLKDI